MLAFWIILAVVVVIGIFIWATYNSLVTLRVRVDEAWSDINVQLKRRLDLIPNLVETVKGYAKHESGVLKQLPKLVQTLLMPRVLKILLLQKTNSRVL